MDIDRVVERLAEWASGSTCTEAAVELLIETEYWLSRREFVDNALVETDSSLTIDWVRARSVADDIQCSRGERFVLKLACSLADAEQTVAMADLAALDGRNLKRVTDALHTAKFGW